MKEQCFLLREKSASKGAEWVKIRGWRQQRDREVSWMTGNRMSATYGKSYFSNPSFDNIAIFLI
jgi:hypothetical protein